MTAVQRSVRPTLSKGAVSAENRVTRFVFILVLVSLLACSEPVTDDDLSIYQITSNKPYEEVIGDLEVVVSEHNFAIVARHAIGRVARKNGRPEFPEVTVLHVCNIDYAIRILDVSLENAINLPCRVAIYQAQDKVVLQARLFSEKEDELGAVASEVNSVLRAMLDFAAE